MKKHDGLKQYKALKKKNEKAGTLTRPKNPKLNRAKQYPNGTKNTKNIRNSKNNNKNRNAGANKSSKIEIPQLPMYSKNSKIRLKAACLADNCVNVLRKEYERRNDWTSAATTDNNYSTNTNTHGGNDTDESPTYHPFSGQSMFEKSNNSDKSKGKGG